MKNYFIISVYILVNFSLRLTATDLYLNLIDSEWWPKIGNKRDGLEPPNSPRGLLGGRGGGGLLWRCAGLSRGGALILSSGSHCASVTVKVCKISYLT